MDWLNSLLDGMRPLYAHRDLSSGQQEKDQIFLSETTTTGCRRKMRLTSNSDDWLTGMLAPNTSRDPLTTTMKELLGACLGTSSTPGSVLFAALRVMTNFTSIEIQ